MCLMVHYHCLCCKKAQSAQRARNCENVEACPKKIIIYEFTPEMCVDCTVAHHSAPCSPPGRTPTVVIFHYGDRLLVEDLQDELHLMQ
jgi:protein-disulfide isomerase